MFFLLVISGVAVAAKPNIIFVLADDLGYGDLASYDHPYALTPRLDQLAKEGVMFRNFHVSAVVCSPSRTGFMTGIHASRYFNSPEYFGFQDRKPITEILQNAGYETGHFGKWHIGPETHQGIYGIDQLKVFDSSHTSEEGRDAEIFDHAIAFIEENRNGPFYVNIWGNSTHKPVNPSTTVIEQMKTFEVDRMLFGDFMQHKFDDAKAIGGDIDDAMHAYLAEVLSLDGQIGKLLDKLEELKIADNTIVIFSSDHGPAPVLSKNADGNDSATRQNMLGWAGGLQGGKHSQFEGGVRTPFIVRWPAKIPSGNVNSSSLISSLDLLPTLSAIAGVELEGNQIDGEDISDILMGADRPRSSPLFWKKNKVNSPEAMLDGTYKLHRINGKVTLFDLSVDPGETADISGENPDLTAELLAKLNAWTASLPQAFARKEDQAMIPGPAVITPIINPPSRAFQEMAKPPANP